MAYPFDPNFLPNNLLHFPSPVTEPVACPVGLDLWLKYRAAHPDGPTVPPECSEDYPNPVPELLAYFNHVNSCDDCNEV
jgi:hypothetical protein